MALPDSPRTSPPTTFTCSRSYAYCEQVARRASSNFTLAFHLLPPVQRRAMYALYAFLRYSDDLGDDPAPLDQKVPALLRWRADLQAALQGEYRHPIHPALGDTVRRFSIPAAYLEAVLDGVAMDLEQSSYDTFADLYGYCYRVASAVGLSCIHIWGFQPGAEEPAEAAGIALQLTNILRDVGEDAARGRIYLPREDLARFDYTPEELFRGVRDDRFRALMAYQAGRAYRYYAAAEPLAPLLPPTGRAVFLLMVRTYRALLDSVVQCDFDVFGARIRVGRWRKLLLALRSLSIRWGLLSR